MLTTIMLPIARSRRGTFVHGLRSAAKVRSQFFALLYIAVLLAIPVVLTSSLPAQEAEDQVHITPRVKPATPGEQTIIPPANVPPVNNIVDPSLKTHTKPIKVDVNLVLVNVTITDPMNRIVTGLEKENFRIFEGNSEQQIKHFSSEDAPLSLGVIFDMSGSMSDKIDKAREAVVEFFKTANPQDEFFLIAFSDRPELISDFTRSVEDIQSKLVYVVPKGRTALLDAIYLGIDKMKQAQNSKKALLIISDGGDNRSRYTESEIKNDVRETDVQIYAIGIFDYLGRTTEEAYGPTLLGDITEVTGGRTYVVNNPNELADTATKIGMELRNQYVLGYRPNNDRHDGKWRKIKVKLEPPKGLPPLHVYSKTGYYAPSE